MHACAAFDLADRRAGYEATFRLSKIDPHPQRIAFRPAIAGSTSNGKISPREPFQNFNLRVRAASQRA
jgi:hypothetical protein